MAVGPSLAMIACSRAAMSSSASSQLTALELPRALRSGPAQRIEDAIRTVDAIEVVIDLRAEPAAGERVIRVAHELRGHAVLDADLPGAGVRTIVRAGALAPWWRRWQRRSSTPSGAGNAQLRNDISFGSPYTGRVRCQWPSAQLNWKGIVIGIGDATTRRSNDPPGWCPVPRCRSEDASRGSVPR